MGTTQAVMRRSREGSNISSVGCYSVELPSWEVITLLSSLAGLELKRTWFWIDGGTFLTQLGPSVAVCRGENVREKIPCPARTTVLESIAAERQDLCWISSWSSTTIFVWHCQQAAVCLGILPLAPGELGTQLLQPPQYHCLGDGVLMSYAINSTMLFATIKSGFL